MHKDLRMHNATITIQCIFLTHLVFSFFLKKQPLEILDGSQGGGVTTYSIKTNARATLLSINISCLPCLNYNYCSTEIDRAEISRLTTMEFISQVSQMTQGSGGVAWIWQLLKQVYNQKVFCVELIQNYSPQI
jgi:hypothetical protein